MFNQKERIALLLLSGSLLLGTGLSLIDYRYSGALEEFQVVRRAVEVPEAAKEVAAVAGPLDLNEATEDQLQSLPSIGPKTAKRIVDYRRTNGPFSSVEEIQKVSGIGPRTFEKLRSLIVVK